MWEFYEHSKMQHILNGIVAHDLNRNNSFVDSDLDSEFFIGYGV